MPDQTSFVKPDILTNNKITINTFLKQSYYGAKKQAALGVTLIQDGASYIKEEFSVFYHETGLSLHKMALPVNNFLNDLAQIENELLQEISKNSPHYVLMNKEMIPVEIVLSEMMEENY